MKHLVQRLKAIAFSLLPEATRHHLIRKQTVYPFAAPEGIRFKLAETQDELSQAFRLLHDAYVSHGYMDPHPSGMRLTKYHALPTTSTLIAVQGSEVVATVSLIRSCPFGLPCELAYDLTTLKRQRARIAEVSALAVHPRYSSRKGYLLWPLLKFMLEYAIHFFGVDYFAIVVTPQWFDFYAATWCVRPFTSRPIKYAYVKGTDAMGGFVKIRHMETQWEIESQRLSPENNQYRYMFETSFETFDFPRRENSSISDPVMTPELLNYFFSEQSDVFSNLTDTEIKILRHLYNTDSYRRVLPHGSAEPIKIHLGEKRFEVASAAELILSESKKIQIQVRSVSHSGLGAISWRQLRRGEEYQLQIDVAKHQTVSLVATVVWQAQDGACGFLILKKSADWDLYIQSLDETLLKAG